MPIYKDSYKTLSLSRPEDFEASLEEKLAILSPEEFEAFCEALAMSEVEGTLFAHEYDRDKVDIETWLDDPYFMGEVTKSLYPLWREDLIEMFGTGLYSTAVLTGSTGTGKSFFSQLVILRMVYEASCLKDPARSYGLATGSALGFCNIASSKETARRVVFEGIESKMLESPYFRNDFFPKRKTKEEIVFPKNIQIIAGSSTDTSIIGMNIFGGIMDEANFVRTASNTASSINLSSAARARNMQKAMRLYTSITRRMKSRFNAKGKLPGILCVLSSKTTTDSFTEQIIGKAVADQDKHFFVRDRSLIDVKRDQFSKETFRVLVGNESYPSRILDPGEDERQFGRAALIVDVPEDLRKDFEDNMEEALRDMLGVSTVAISSFMSRVDLVEKMRDESRTHPFVCALHGNPTEWDSRLPYRMLWERIARQQPNGEWAPIRNPDSPRVIHLDPASTGDAFGFAMGHISHYVKHGDAEEMPVYDIDFMLRIKGEPGAEVLFKNVRKLIYDLSDHGFHITFISSDQYQSKEMLQALDSKGYKTDNLSVDLDKEPYRFLRSVIYDERVKCYDYPVLFHELKNLEENPLKIDHRPMGSKDIADAVCGVITNLHRLYRNRQPNLPVKGISIAQTPERQKYVVSEELFAEQERKEAEVAAKTKEQLDKAQVVAKQVWPKKPQSVPSTYRKKRLDGTVQDLKTGEIIDPDDLLMRG